MQKVINVIALLSGLTSLIFIGTGVYVYLRKDVMVERIKENVSTAAVGAITDALPGLIDAAMPAIPEVPKTTGGAIPTVPSGLNR